MSSDSLPEIPLDLLKRYNQPGPRYTSYPTAPLFQKDFGAAQFEAEILNTNASSTRPLSLYFHLPFCDTLCYFCGCTMIVTKERQKIAEYLEYLKKEIRMLKAIVNPHRPVAQLQWGGGTPTYLTPREIQTLGESIRNAFPNFEKEIEAGCEIDPRDLTCEHLKALKEAGFNRVSMGVQDFDPKVQQAVNRIQPESITRQTLEWARELGFKSINLDLIYGLPFQTVRSFEKTLQKIIALDADRLAIFNYAHVPWLKKHQKLILEKDLPTPEEKLLLLKRTIEMLKEAGYIYIGMDHFAKPEDELARAQRQKTLYRNFQGYSTKSGCDVYALGMSAISQFEWIYAQNAKTLPEYYRALDEGRFSTHAGYRLTRDDQIRREVITRLMCDFELDLQEMEKRFAIDFNAYFDADLKKIEPFEKEGLCFKQGRKLIVSEVGRLLIRNIVMNFDAHLDAFSKEKPIFSKTI